MCCQKRITIGQPQYVASSQQKLEVTKASRQVVIFVHKSVKIEEKRRVDQTYTFFGLARERKAERVGGGGGGQGSRRSSPPLDPMVFSGEEGGIFSFPRESLCIF